MYTSYAETYSAANSQVKRAEETSEAEPGRGHRRYDQYITHTSRLKLKTLGTHLWVFFILSQDMYPRLLL